MNDLNSNLKKKYSHSLFLKQNNVKTCMLCVIVIVHVLSASTQNTVHEIQNALLAELKPHLFTLILK